MRRDELRRQTERFEALLDRAEHTRQPGTSFDELREEFCRLKVTSLDGALPAELPFAEIVDCTREEGRAVLVLRNYSQEKLEAQAQTLNCEIEIETLPLEEIYKIVVSE